MVSYLGGDDLARDGTVVEMLAVALPARHVPMRADGVVQLSRREPLWACG